MKQKKIHSFSACTFSKGGNKSTQQVYEKVLNFPMYQIKVKSQNYKEMLSQLK